MDKAKSAVKTVGFITIALLLAKALGMGREVLFYNLYGTTSETDAFINASRIPVLFFDLTLGAAVLSTFIPIFSRYLQESREKAFEFANTFLNIVILISSAFCIIAIIFSKQISTIAQLPHETLILSSKLLVILLPTAVFTAVAYVFVGILQSMDEFNIPAIISVVSNCAIIIYLFFFSWLGVYGLSITMLLAWGLQIVVQIPSLLKKGYRYKPILKLRDSGIRDAFVLAVPALIGSWIQPVCVLINSYYASGISEGALSSFDAANKLYIMIVGVFVFAITNYVFPKLSKMSGEGDYKAFGQTIKTSVLSMFAIIIPVACAMALFADKIVNALFVNKDFNVQLTSDSLRFFSLGMIALGINEILSKGFYAMKNGKAPMYASLAGIGINFVSAYLLFNYTPLSIGGLALATSIALTVIALILITKMQRTATFIDKKMLLSSGLIAFMSVCMSGVAYGVSVLLAPMELNRYVDLGVVALTGIVVYGALFILFKVHKRIGGGMV